MQLGTSVKKAHMTVFVNKRNTQLCTKCADFGQNMGLVGLLIIIINCVIQ